MLIDNRMPDLSRIKDPQQQVNALYQYLFTLVQQMNYVLSNLDETNLSKELQATIRAEAKTGETDTAAKQEMYPVGSVYMNVNAATDPAKLFGGKWEMIDTGASNYFCWQRKE